MWAALTRDLGGRVISSSQRERILTVEREHLRIRHGVELSENHLGEAGGTASEPVMITTNRNRAI